MTDLERVERAIQRVLARCQEANPDNLSIPPSGETVMGWFATELRLAIEEDRS